MKKSLQTKTLKRGMAAALVLLLTMLSIHSCKQERLQPEQRKQITADRNKTAGLKSNSQKSLQSIPQRSLSGGACYFAVPHADGWVTGPTGPTFNMVCDYISQELYQLCTKNYETSQAALSDYQYITYLCYLYAVDHGCNFQVGVLFDPVEQVCPGDEGYVVGGVISPTTAPTRDIRNKTQDPCISKAVDMVLGANKDIEGKIAEIIKRFDQSKSLNLNIYDGITSDGHSGEMFFSSFDGSIYNASIRLQTSYFKGTDAASQESLAAILIHEVLHSYIKNQNPSLLDTAHAHHNMIVANYITPMSDYLSSVFGMSRKDAFSLAWSGVADSDVFSKASVDDLFPYSYTENATNYTISISKQEIMSRGTAYNANMNYGDEGKKGTKVCPD